MAFTGLKKFSDWPTYPQLYSNGELVGGLDIVKEMKESDTLDSLLPKQQSLDERYTCSMHTLRIKPVVYLYHFVKIKGLSYKGSSDAVYERQPRGT